MVCFHCPTPMPIHIPIPILIIWSKAPLGMIPMVILMHSDENYYKNHIISTDFCVKLGAVPICIRIVIGIEIAIGSVETVLHVIILAIWIRIGIGISIGIGVGMWKHTITKAMLCNMNMIAKVGDNSPVQISLKDDNFNLVCPRKREITFGKYSAAFFEQVKNLIQMC